MIDITKLYCGKITRADSLRYGKTSKSDEYKLQIKDANDRRPVTVWNITNTCNLKCLHCYANSENKKYENELTTLQAKEVIKDLAAFKIPSLLFSGGEPLMRKDIFELAKYAKSQGVRVVLSTNGTLITSEIAKRIKDVGFIYVGISLDGMESINDYFRGIDGAFQSAMQGFRNLVEIGQRVGLRFTLTKQNILDLDSIFDFLVKEKINRACFYHLVYSGRGNNIIPFDLTKQETENAIKTILNRTKKLYDAGHNIDILTVDNHVDGVYTYLKLLEEKSKRANEVYELLKWNGGAKNSSGVGIGAIDAFGFVHPDQFWSHYSLGNVLERPFSEIWQDTSDELMSGLKNRLPLLKGKCKTCKYKELCGGSFRVRADLIHNDPWMPDPACYLDENII